MVKKWVGNGGSCPGYRSQLYLSSEKGISYSVMINSSGTDPGKYIIGMHEILKKVTKITGSDSNKFKDIEGVYIAQPWNSETYIQSWGDHIALLFIPSDSPELNLYKNIEKDVFKKNIEK